MVMLKTPNEPATSKQLWLLHILTKSDTRNLKLTMQQASDKINELQSHKSKTPISKPIETIPNKPQSERQVIQGMRPNGQTDMDKVKADFMLNAYPIGLKRVNNETTNIDFYDFNCKDCLFGQSGICEPQWSEAGYMTCAGKIESMNFKCDNYEPTSHRLSEYCHRPKGKQCHRKSAENKCLECAFRSPKWRMDYQNHTAWFDYIPTINERIADYTKNLETLRNPGDIYKDLDLSESIKRNENIIRMLQKLL